MLVRVLAPPTESPVNEPVRAADGGLSAWVLPTHITDLHGIGDPGPALTIVDILGMNQHMEEHSLKKKICASSTNF